MSAPLLAFPVISDVHIGTGSAAVEKFTDTLTQLNQLCPEQAAFVVVGDLTENGELAQFEDFMRVKQNHQLAGVPWLMTIGNHDYWNGLSATEAQARFLTQTGNLELYFSRVIQGYHFIVLATEDGVTEGTFSLTQLAWLENELAQAARADANKPILVFHHQPLTGTIWGSQWGLQENRDRFYAILAKYPQVISFSGHTHFPLDHPRIVQQKDFTSVGTSTTAYLFLDDNHLQGEVPETFANECNQAWLVEVYEDEVRLRARDITKKCWLAEYHIRPDDFRYTDGRDQEAPIFAENAEIELIEADSNSLTLAFPQATDNLFVYDYLVKFDRLELQVFSEFYKNPVPKKLIVKLEHLTPNQSYHIELRARDAFDNVSAQALEIEAKTK